MKNGYPFPREKLSVSGLAQNQEDACFQIIEALEHLRYQGNVHAHFVPRTQSKDPLVIRITVEEKTEQEIRIEPAEASKTSSITKAVVDQLNL
jgi:hypothetical protein